MSLYETIVARIESIANAEKITKAELGSISRELLEYLVLNDSNDIATVNRLMKVLTPMNKKTAGLFFEHFLPFVYHKELMDFGAKMKGDKKIDKKFHAVREFLETEGNNIWTWANENLELDKKPVPFEDRITAIVKQALTGTKKQEAIDSVNVLKAVLEGGIEADQLYAAIDLIEANNKEGMDENAHPVVEEVEELAEAA